jgi:selenide,water dikinase
MQSLPLTRDLVLIGGGHTHALVLKRWGMTPLPGARLTLIDPGPAAAYSGMLPGFVAGHYDRSELDIDLVRLTRFAGARLILGAASALDPVARTVAVPGRPPISYDVASFDIGITSDMPDLPGFADWAVPAKPLAAFASRWAAFRARRDPAGVVVIGGGVAGAELAMAMAHALSRADRATRPPVRLIDKGQALAAMTRAGQRIVRSRLADLGVEMIEQATVTGIGPTSVTLSDGRVIASDFTTGAAGARPYEWVRSSGLASKEGFLAVGTTLQTSDPAVFAVGDCADMTENPRPKAGVFAVRQAPVLFDNLRALLAGGPLSHYRPQKDYLKLVSLGDRSALAEKWGFAANGKVLWQWKDRIDRRFMARFGTLAPMAQPPLPPTFALGVREAVGDHPSCAGCGAKVGRAALGGGLGLVKARRGDVDRLPGDDAAILNTGGVRQVITTDHLRTVTADPVLMTRIAAIHALGDIWAMGAMPQAALVSLTLPRMSEALQARTLAEIMGTADDVLGREGAAIAGGHTSVGEELTIGFTLTGLCDRDPVTLAGGRPGDALILTKPLGSGVILAAEMRGRATGGAVAACHDIMTRSQAEASRILSAAHAMTDVTGFGLAGHLSGICAASGTGAALDLGAIPLMAGAAGLAAEQIRSSLWQDNRSGSGPVFGAAGPVGDLLFDPQTCGGLLAAVAADNAVPLLAALRAAGYNAAIIGRLTEGAPVITCHA